MSDTALRDRWGRYLIAPPDGRGKPRGYTRVTTIAKTLDSGDALIPWKATATVVGALRRPGLHSRWQALLAEHPDPWYASEDSKAECKRLVEECATAGGSADRAEMGTSLHSLTELYDAGRLDPATLLDGARRDLDAYAAAMAASGLTVVPELIECLLVLDEHEVAGTTDRILRTADGRHVIADVKTGTDLRYSWRSIAVQLAAYAHADARYDQATGTRHPMPDVDRTTGIVIHLPAGEGRCTLHHVDLEAGWQAFQASMWTRRWRKRNDLATPLTIPARVPAGAPVELPRIPGQLPPRPAVETIDEGPEADPDALAALARRFAELDDDARAAILTVTAAADAAGHPLSLKALPSVRRFEIGRALIDLAAYGWDDEVARALVAHVTDDPAVEQPGVPLGAAVGRLTIDRARALSDLAARLASSDLVMGCRPDGTLCVGEAA